MNMISTGSFLTETGASNKQSELVKKLTAAWEKKNSKTARAGGASLMALSLAACGGEDNTPFSQSDVDAAKAEGIASVDITSDNAAAITSNDADIAAAAKTEALTTADGTIYATVDAAYSAGSNLTSAAAVTAALTDASGTVHASVDAAITSNDAAIESSATAAAESSLMAGSGFATVAGLLTAYTNATAAPATTSALTTSNDVETGTSGNNAITGTASTFNTGDVISDSSATDADTLTVTSSADLSSAANAATVVGIETIKFEYTGSGTSNGVTTDAIFEVAVDNIREGNIVFDTTTTGNTLTSATVTKVVNGVTLTFSDDFDTIIVDSSTDNVGLNVTANNDGAAVTVQDAAGTVDDVTLTGAGDLTLSASTNDGDLIVTSGGDLTITDADVAAGTVTLTATGSLNIDGLEAATTVTLSGAGTGASASDWTEGDNTAAVTKLYISGNGAAHTLNIANADLTALNEIIATGDQDVTVSVSANDVDGLTVATSATGVVDQIKFTDNTTAGTTTLDINTAGTIDTRAVEADKIQLSADMTDTVTVASGQHLVIATDQAATLTVAGAAASAATNAVTIDLKDDATAGTANDATMTTSNIKEVTINALDSSAGSTLTSLNVGTTNNVTVNADLKAVTFATDITANKLTLNTTKATTVVAGAANSVKELDAGGSSGAITVTQGTALATITLGSGGDTVTMGDAATNTTIDGGAGSDTVDLAAGDYSAEILTFSNIETLLMDNGADVKASLLSGKSYVITDTNASADINVIGDVATIDLGNLAVDTGRIADTNINVTAQATAGSTINITGTNGVDTVNATGATGVVTLNLGAGADVVTATGSNNDVINTGAGDDTVTDAGAGNDTIDLGAGGDTLTTAGGGDDTITAGEGTDTIESGAGNDTIILTETTSVVDTVQLTLSGAANLDSVSGFVVNKDVVEFGRGNIVDNGGGNDTLSTIQGTDINAAIASGAMDAVSVSATAGATTLANATNLIFLSTGASTFAAAIGNASLVDTAGGNTAGLAATEGVAASWYDTDTNEAVIGYIEDTNANGTALNSSDTFHEAARIEMALSDYTLANIDAAITIA